VPIELVEQEPSKTNLYEHSKIAFISNRDGNREIYVMNTDGSEQKRLTDNPASDNNPCWSPFKR